MAAVATVDELRARQKEIESRLQELDAEFAGETLPLERREEWNLLNEEMEQLEEKIVELEARAERLREISRNPKSREEATGGLQIPAPNRTTGDDIYNLATIRATFDDPESARSEMRDRALRSLDVAHFDHERANREDCQTHISKLLDRETSVGSTVDDSLARRMLVTGSPTYRRAMNKYVAGRGLTSEEQRALSVGTGSAGGFALVYTLDPTVVPTSNYSVNPFRAIARVETISGTNEWKAVTAGAVTAAYAAEATQASDNAPTLAQPDIIVEKAQAFIPFSIELGEDWAGLQAAMAMELSDAKDDLEATKFAVGAGHGSTEPKGIITGATATTTAGGSAAFAIADLYKVFEALPPRFRPRAQWVGNLFTWDKVRQFDTAGGSGVWVDAFGVGGGRGLTPAVGGLDSGQVTASAGPLLLGKPVWEATAMASALTTGQKILVIGDFRYFVIVDRVGMNVEFIQNLVGANQRPTGQRGLYCYWRNSSDVLSTAAFQVLVTG
jgi:HK97 family phage major capsid protein